MGLLSTEVEVGLDAKNAEYYEKLGYKIPRYYNKEKKEICSKTWYYYFSKSK